jgi:hypothetical protein
MKKIHFIYILFSFLVIAASCKKDEIMLYEGDNYIQFTKGYEDSSLFSFLSLTHKDEALTPMVVELVGDPQNRDRSYKIAVVKELTTAAPANYILPESFTFRANKVIDTAWITVKKTPEIALKPVKLVVRLEASNDFKVGQTDHAAAILYISNIIARPDWWNGSVEGRFMGDYSDKKYKLFIEVTGQSDLDPANEDQIRYHTVVFRNYLLKEKDAGRTVYEDNGEEMTVAYIGG